MEEEETRRFAETIREEVSAGQQIAGLTLHIVKYAQTKLCVTLSQLRHCRFGFV